MNIFLTSIMHPETASNFSTVERSFELMARSVCEQTDRDFLLVVVCCSIPEITFKHKNIRYHVVDFPAAKNADRTSKRMDKGTKIISGLLFINKYNPKYVHILDADDWINKKLNAFLNSKALSDVGWYINAGYIVDLSENRTQLKYGLNRYCGSTFISNYFTLMKNLSINNKLNSSSTQGHIMALVSKEILLDLIAAHAYTEFYSKYNLKYKRIPFRGVGWVRNTGENILSGGAVKQGLCLDKKTLSLFGLESISLENDCKNSVRDYASYVVSSLFSFTGWLFSKKKNKFTSDC